MHAKLQKSVWRPNIYYSLVKEKAELESFPSTLAKDTFTLNAKENSKYLHRLSIHNPRENL